MNILEVENLNVQLNNGMHGKRDKYCDILKDISFTIEQGEIVGLVGDSGAGKTICVKAICGLLPENSIQTGKITGNRKEMAMIFQDTSGCLDPTMKIGSQIVETIKCQDKCRKQSAEQRAVRLLDMVGIVNPMLCMEKYPFECSGGMRQRIVIAIAIASGARLLIADEPTTALDAAVQVQIMQLLLKIVKEQKLTLLLISHDTGLITNLCDRIFVMKQGRMTEQVCKKRLQKKEQLLKKQSVFQDIRQKDKETQALIELRTVSKKFAGELEAVRNVSMKIYKGDTYGLLGESGSGKTTIARMLLGLLSYDQGEICYRGKKLIITDEKSRRKFWKQAQMVFQDPYGSLNPKVEIFKALSEMKSETKAGELLEQVGLKKEYWNHLPSELSGGQCQRAGIARALLSDPSFLICDEPTSALDATSKYEIMELLDRMKREKNMTYLWITHDFISVRQICNRIGVLYQGILVEEGRTEELLSDPWHPYTKELIQAALQIQAENSENRKLRAGKSLDFSLQYEKKEKMTGICPYRDRCRYALKECESKSLQEYVYGERKVSCLLYADEWSKKRDGKMAMTAQI